jgi:hypothetical protein
MKRGFERRGICHDDAYPSGVLLEKPISKIPYPMNPQFIDCDDVPAVFSPGGPEDPAYVPYVLIDVKATSLLNVEPSPVSATRHEPTAHAVERVEQVGPVG